MTEETRTEAEKLSRAEGSGDGAIKQLDKWAVREKEKDDLYRRDVESNIAFRARDTERSDARWALLEKDQTRGVELRETHHAIWVAEVKHAQEHRSREVSAFERIADALEKLAVK